MRFVLQTPTGREEIDPSWIKGVTPSRTAWCELDTDWRAIPLTVDQAQSVAKQDFRRALQEEHQGGCDLCFWKCAGHKPCDSLCCQLAVYGLERGVDLRLRNMVIEPAETTDVGESIRWGLLFSAVVLGLILVNNVLLSLHDLFARIRLPSYH